MTSNEFFQRLRALHNIDGYCLPEFDVSTQERFCRDPVYFFLACDSDQRAVIWRELEKRHQANLELLGLKEAGR